jgi:glutamate-ammonia-ligase adenylyltransferase
MGYQRPADVIAAVRGWHHGRYAAVRTPRARELLTEVQPALIRSVLQGGQSDLALIGFGPFRSDVAFGRAAVLAVDARTRALLELIAALMGPRPSALSRI